MKQQLLVNNEDDLVYTDRYSTRYERHSVRSIMFTITAVIMVFVIFSLLMPPLLMVIGQGIYQLQILPAVHLNQSACDKTCTATLVESIPENLTYSDGSPSHARTYDVWRRLIDSANTTIDIASFYWTLRGDDIPSQDPSSKQGEDILKRLVSAVKDRKIKMRIVENASDNTEDDLELLIKAGAEVRYLNMTQFFGAGVLHTKLMIYDDKHMYVGSANMDWRSLTQVKELGASVSECPCLVDDLKKLFEVYWMLASPDAHIPDKWPKQLTTIYNSAHPMKVKLNGTSSQVYISSSPGLFCPDGRTSDIDSIIDVIMKAKKFIHISVMDYSPSIVYSSPQRYWPVIDNALRNVSLEKGVQVRLMASKWDHTSHSLSKYLRSLSDISGAMNASIQTKFFKVPATEAQAKIPYSRVNHNKYMVTDNAAYIGTSNWSGDYFVATAGLGLIVTDDGSGESLRQQLQEIFERDWNSPYAYIVNESESI